MKIGGKQKAPLLLIILDIFLLSIITFHLSITLNKTLVFELFYISRVKFQKNRLKTLKSTTTPTDYLLTPLVNFWLQKFYFTLQ